MTRRRTNVEKGTCLRGRRSGIRSAPGGTLSSPAHRSGNSVGRYSWCGNYIKNSAWQVGFRAGVGAGRRGSFAAVDGRRLAAVGLAAVERPSVVEPERYATDPHRRGEELVVAGYLGHHDYRRHRYAYRAREKARHADKRERSRRLLELSDQKTHAFYQQYIGKDAEVLFEKAPRGKAMHGFTKNYIRVELKPSEARDEFDNQLINVSMGDFNHDKTALKAMLNNG